MEFTHTTAPRPSLTPFKPKSLAERLINRVKDPKRREEVRKLHDVIARASALPAQMWGPNIIGFGRYEYEAPGGRDSEFVITGLSAKDKRIAIYLNPGYEEFEAPLEKLGKFERGKSCIMIRRISDIDLGVLETLVKRCVRTVKSRYQTYDT